MLLSVAQQWGGGPFGEAEWWRGPSVSAPRCHLPIGFADRADDSVLRPDQVADEGDEAGLPNAL